METRIAVVGLVRKDNMILLGQKPPGKGPYPDTWHLPGGGIDNNETCEEALKREILEEAGIEIKNCQQAAWDTDTEPNKHGKPTYYIFLQFTCEYAGGDVQAGHDMEHFEWVPLSSLKEYNLNKPTKRFLAKLQLMTA